MAVRMSCRNEQAEQETLSRRTDGTLEESRTAKKNNLI